MGIPGRHDRFTFPIQYETRAAAAKRFEQFRDFVEQMLDDTKRTDLATGEMRSSRSHPQYFEMGPFLVAVPVLGTEYQVHNMSTWAGDVRIRAVRLELDLPGDGIFQARDTCATKGVLNVGTFFARADMLLRQVPPAAYAEYLTRSAQGKQSMERFTLYVPDRDRPLLSHIRALLQAKGAAEFRQSDAMDYILFHGLISRDLLRNLSTKLPNTCFINSEPPSIARLRLQREVRESLAETVQVKVIARGPRG